jgi:hypothetical protein
MEQAATNILVKIIAWCIVLRWYVKDKYRYVANGHFAYDLKSLVPSKADTPGEEFISYLTADSGKVPVFDGEVVFARQLEEIDASMPAISEYGGDVVVKLNHNCGYSRNVYLGGGVSTKIKIDPHGLYPIPKIVYSVISKEAQFRRLIADGDLVIIDNKGKP